MPPFLPLLAGCGIRAMLPSGPVLTPEQAAAFDAPRPSPATCGGPAPALPPVVPLQVFGLRYDVDIVLSTRGTGWDMHEYARVDTPDGPLWLAKDSDERGVQTIVADVADIEGMLAEVPVPRVRGPVRVEDRSEGDRVDLSLAYTNARGEPVEVEFSAQLPDRPPRLRNGSTMGHSRQAVAAVLDLQRMTGRARARISIDGRRRPLRRLLGVVPVRYLLRQVQGGVAVADFRVEPAGPGAFTLVRPAGPGAVDPATGEPGWPTRAREAWTWDGRVARYQGGLVRFELEFVEGGLARATVRQWGVDEPVFELRLDPALPDLRCPWEGVVASRFRMDVGGQIGHGTGIVEARREGPGIVRLALRPTAPWWLADRPMDVEVRLLEGGAYEVRARRVPADG